MKGLWIRVEAHEVDSVRVAQLSEHLGVEPYAALGLLVALGGQVAEQTPDGHIANVPNATLERWARWSGKRGAFATAVREILQDGEGYLEDWRESMGKLVERREKDRLRKTPGKGAELPASGDGNSTESGADSSATGRYGTGRHEEGDTPAGAARHGKPAKIDTLAMGELVNRIRALRTSPPVGAPFIARSQVEALGSDILRAFDAVGGSSRFLDAQGKDYSFLVREFGEALRSAQQS